jgi:hypothetical protein
MWPKGGVVASQLWKFKQEEYIAKHSLAGQEEGVCLALSARWAKMRLKKPGQTLTETSRTGYFEKPPKTGKQGVHSVIANMQDAYDTIRVPAQKLVGELDTKVESIFQQYMDNKISWGD